MQGSLAEISLVDLIQINCLERKRARLRLWFEHHEAVLFFDEGEIVHARTGNLEGRDALFDVLTWATGTFEMVNGIAPPMRSLDDTWSGLLLEGMRRIDESNRDRGATGGEPGSAAVPPSAVPGNGLSGASGTSGANEIGATRGAATSSGETGATDLVARLRAIQGIEGALVVRMDGTVLAEEIGDDSERLGAIAIFLITAARRLGEAFTLNRFCRGIIALPRGRYMVVDLPGGLCAGLLLDDRTAPDLLRPALERAFEEPAAAKGVRSSLGGLHR